MNRTEPVLFPACKIGNCCGCATNPTVIFENMGRWRCYSCYERENMQPPYPKEVNENKPKKDPYADDPSKF